MAAGKSGELTEPFSITLLVTGLAPVPDVPDGPNVDPVVPDTDQVVPEGKFGLGPFIYKTAKAAIKDVAVRKKGCAALGRDCRSIVSAINANAITTVSDALDELAKKNGSSLDELKVNRTEWEGVSIPLQKKLIPLRDAGSFKTMEGLITILNEMAVGYEAASK
jgi:hypothetical protein